MKKIIWIVSLIVGTSALGFAQNQDPYYDNTNNTDDVYYNDQNNYNEYQADNDGMSYQTFYDQLSPFGSWINYSGYGYVWVPQADAGFSPYMTAGHWEYTDMGWTWVSDYEWGWATFHYGRWFFDAYYGGWLWLPGYDWAPAWVNWGYYEGYYCWTPIGPRDYVNGRWGYGNYEHQWNCLPREHMGEPFISRYMTTNNVINHDRRDFESRVTIINNTNVYNRSVFNAGPKVEEVERVVNHPINRTVINASAKPGKTEIHGNTINIYRPAVTRNPGQQHAVPARVVNPTEIQHNNNTQPRTEPSHTNTEPRTEPARNNEPRQQEWHNWTPPRQNTPRPEPQMQPRQTEPTQRYNGGGFIPSERPSYQQHSAPMPSFHAPSGGGGHMGGGGRHL